MVDSDLQRYSDELLLFEAIWYEGTSADLKSLRRILPKTDNAEHSDYLQLQEVIDWKQDQVAEVLVNSAVERHYLRAFHRLSRLPNARLCRATLSPTLSFEMLDELSQQELSEDEWTLI